MSHTYYNYIHHKCGAIFVTRVTLIVVSIDFFLSMGPSLFVVRVVIPIARVVEYSCCKPSIRNPGIIIFFYSRIGRKRIAICDMTKYLTKCFCVKIFKHAIGNIFKETCIKIMWQYIAIVVAIAIIIIDLWSHWL